MELVAGLACVDWVVGFGADTPLRLIERLRPDVLAKGGDWASDEIVGAEEVRSWGGRVERLALGGIEHFGAHWLARPLRGHGKAPLGEHLARELGGHHGRPRLG